jgi:K+-sensing histidine kinase KdpD
MSTTNRRPEAVERSAAPARPILALLDDTAEGAALIEWSARLARVLQRELELVYVENTQALAAAALPDTRVLAHAGGPWQAFAPQDIERGFRMQAERLRTLAGAIGSRHAVDWSLRTLRGTLAQAALGLFGDEDLLFVGSPMPLRALAQRGMPGRRTRPAVVLLATDERGAGARDRAAATQLAREWSALLQVLTVAPGADLAELLLRGSPLQADLLVLPRALATQRGLARVPCPALLVA